MKDPLAQHRELQSALEAMRELRRALDPMRDIREAVNALRISDPLVQMRQALNQFQAHDPLAEHRKAIEALRLHDPLAETRKLLENLKFEDPLQHTRELIQALRTSTAFYYDLQNRGVSVGGTGAAMANPKAYVDVEDDPPASEEVLEAITRTLSSVRTAVSIRLLDRLGVEFYMNLILTLLLLVYQLQLNNASEQKITAEIIETREQILRKFENLAAEHVDSGTYYVVRRTCVLVQSPKSRSPAVGVVYPNQLTRLVQRKGKRIRVEYFDHLAGVHQTGWCLKKYLERLPSSSTRSVAQKVTHIPSEVVARDERLSLLDLQGLGKELWSGMDATQHVADERGSWD